MRLLPRVLRPSWLLRRWAMFTGMRSDSSALRFLALLVVGRTAFLRQRSMRYGVYGGNRGWQVIAAGFFVNDAMKKLTVKEVEVLSTEKLTAGQGVSISSIPPRTRRRRSA